MKKTVCWIVGEEKEKSREDRALGREKMRKRRRIKETDFWKDRKIRRRCILEGGKEEERGK